MRANRHGNLGTGVGHFLTADQTFGRVHGDCANHVFAEMLCNFQHQTVAIIVGFESRQNLGQLIGEADVDNGADDLGDRADSVGGGHDLVYLLPSNCLERFSARDDFNEFGSDRGLTAAVIFDGQLVDELAGVARGIVHGGHRCALFARRIFKERAEELDRKVARQQFGEDFLFVRLIIDSGIAAPFFALRDGDRNELLRLRFLDQRRFELGIKEPGNVELFVFEPCDEILWRSPWRRHIPDS